MESLTIVTASRNRSDHLKEQIRSLAKLESYKEHIVIDYGSSEPISEDPELKHGRCRVLRVDYADSWWLTHAYNLAFSYCKTPLILKVDADTVINSDSFLQEVKNRLKESELLLNRFGLQEWKLEDSLFKSSGIFAARTSALKNVCGFNPYIKGWGWDEVDLHCRLFMSGHSVKRMPIDGIYEIKHSDTVRAFSSQDGGSRILDERAQRLNQTTNNINSFVAKYCIEKSVCMPSLVKYQEWHDKSKLPDLKDINPFTELQRHELLDRIFSIMTEDDSEATKEKHTQEEKSRYLLYLGVAITPLLLPNKITNNTENIAKDGGSKRENELADKTKVPCNSESPVSGKGKGDKQSDQDKSDDKFVTTNKRKVKIDIGLPLYRVNKESAFAQFSAGFQEGECSEVIICDNLVDREVLAIPRLDHVRYEKNTSNIGGAENFIKCWHLSYNRYFAWLGDDDFLHPRFASVFSKMIEEEGDLYSAWFCKPAISTNEGLMQEELGGRWLNTTNRIDRCKSFLQRRSWNYLFYGVYDKKKIKITPLERLRDIYDAYLPQVDQCWSYANLVLNPFGWKDSSLFFYNNKNWNDETWVKRECLNFKAHLSKKAIDEIGDTGINQLLDIHLIFLMLLYFTFVIEEHEDCVTNEWPEVNACIRMWCIQQILTTSLRANSHIASEAFVNNIRTGETTLRQLLVWAAAELDHHGQGSTSFTSLCDTRLNCGSISVKAVFEAKG